MRKNIAIFSLAFLIGAAAACMAQDAAKAETDVSTDAATSATVENRLANIESTLAKLVETVGSPSGSRTDLSDYIQQQFLSLDRSIRDLQSDVKRLENEVRKLKNR